MPTGWSFGEGQAYPKAGGRFGCGFPHDTSRHQIGRTSLWSNQMGYPRDDAPASI